MMIKSRIPVFRHDRALLSFIPSLHIRLGLSVRFFNTPRRPRVSQESYIRSSAPITGANDLLEKAASSNDLTRNQVDAFLELSKILLQENSKYNLTAIRKPDDVIRKHIVDGLTLLPTLNQESPSRIVDVGTGAGLPGLVLAIARPDLQFTLLDSVRKKTAFHELAVRELGLRNVNSVWSRAEDAGQDPALREQFCVALARSVAELRVLAELTIPFTRVGGSVIAQKSVRRSQNEIKSASKSIQVCGAILESVERAWPQEWCEAEGGEERSEGEDVYKALVTIRKVSATPHKYPRKPGIPKKSPL